MTSDTIAYGESYDLEIAIDSDLDEVIDDTWSVAYRFTDARTSGNQVAAGTMTIADGKARESIDTGDSPWSPGIYFYDVRITDPDGNEYVSEMIELVVCHTQTQPA